MSVSVMYRQVQQVPQHMWSTFLDLEKRMEEAEASRGYPIARRYRPLFGHTVASTRISSRIFESYAVFAKLQAQRFLDDELAKLDAELHTLLNAEREELYYVDSGAPVRQWMQAISRKPFAPEHIACALPKYELVRDEEMIRQHIDSKKLRVLYRQTQHVPKDRWAEKMEQERLSDASESRAGNPVPLRLRSMHSPLDSHIRISEREYDCFEDLCRGTENFFAERTDEDTAVMDQECRRQEFFTWEQEEIYIVDSDGFVPDWMSQKEEHHR